MIQHYLTNADEKKTALEKPTELTFPFNIPHKG
jgi:hypothetical protein